MAMNDFVQFFNIQLGRSLGLPAELVKPSETPSYDSARQAMKITQERIARDRGRWLSIWEGAAFDLFFVSQAAKDPNAPRRPRSKKKRIQKKYRKRLLRYYREHYRKTFVIKSDPRKRHEESSPGATRGRFRFQEKSHGMNTRTI